MADLFIQQAKEYSLGRPSYPDKLFDFIASTTPSHDLAWDVGTGTGQAAQSIGKIYKNIIATDTSQKQLDYATKLPNITYKCTPKIMSMEELKETIGSESSFDLVTVAQALHWFDLPSFYQQVKYLLKKPNGVFAAWCYTLPEINPEVDSVLLRFYSVDCEPYWESARKMVDAKYETIDFPFEPVEGLDHIGPFRFDSERVIDIEGYLTYLRSWSCLQTAKQKGVELLGEKMVEEFTRAWNEDGKLQKTVTYPVYLKIGKVGHRV